mgnify:CR=1 FL=1
MFTGIIETIGEISSIVHDDGNLHLEIKSKIFSELKIDQSVSHNGVCLTVVEIKPESYVVTAIKETLDKSNLNTVSVGDIVNLERAMVLGNRLDGHLVQGHVDQTGVCIEVKEADGSYYYTFKYNDDYKNITIEKG